MMKIACFFAAALVSSGAAAEAAPLKAVVFDLEMVTSVLDPPRDPQTERLRTMSAHIRELLAKSGQVAVIDTTPSAAEIAKNLPLRDCHDCDLDIAKKLGADIEVTTAVQNLSSAILAFSGAIRDVKTGKTLRSASVDIRGNTDDLWRHGVTYLIKDRLLDPPLPDSPEAMRAVLDK